MSRSWRTGPNMIDSLSDCYGESESDDERGELVSSFWYLITGLSFLVAIVNFSIAVLRRTEPMVALARGLAGAVSLVAGIGIIVGNKGRVRGRRPIGAKIMSFWGI